MRNKIVVIMSIFVIVAVVCVFFMYNKKDSSASVSDYMEAVDKDSESIELVDVHDNSDDTNANDNVSDSDTNTSNITIDSGGDSDNENINEDDTEYGSAVVDTSDVPDIIANSEAWREFISSEYYDSSYEFIFHDAGDRITGNYRTTEINIDIEGVFGMLFINVTSNDGRDLIHQFQCEIDI